MVVVEGGNILHHVKKEGNCPIGGNAQIDMSRDMSSGEMSGSRILCTTEVK